MKGIGKTNAFVLSLLVVGVMVLTVGTAGAVTNVTFSFSSPTGNLGPTEIYTSNGTSITVSGFKQVGTGNTTSTWNLPTTGVTAADLFGTGTSLGVVGETANNTINAGEIIQLDLHELTNETLNLTINGTVKIYGSPIAVANGGHGTLLATFTSTGSSLSFSPGSNNLYAWISVTPNSSHASLGSFSAVYNGVSAVPEPTSLLLLGTGLVGMGIGMRAWRRKK